MDQFEQIPQLGAEKKELKKLTKEQLLELQAVTHILPFKINNYILDELIDWDNIPEDPIYNLYVPQPDMLQKKDLNNMINC